MGKYMIIPDRNRMEKSLELARQYGLGFEADDFFEPSVLQSPECKEEILAVYRACELPKPLTIHGSFHDVLIFSEDEEIRKVSGKRVEESIAVARELGATAVVFHTNLNPALITSESYRQHWIDRNHEFWRGMCGKYPDVTICLENMFDTGPEELSELCKKMQGISNFGVTFDYAHAALYGGDSAKWAEMLAPYIRHVHINDNDGRNDLHLAVGSGVLDWNKFEDLRQRYFADATVLIETAVLEEQVKSLEFLHIKGNV